MAFIAETHGQSTFNVDGEYDPLIIGIREMLPEFKTTFNTIIIPAFECFKSKNIIEYFDSLPVSQRSVEMSKQLGDSINNLFEKLLLARGLDLMVEQADGYDWVYKNLRNTKIEDKNAMSPDPNNRSWVGNSNSGRKVSMHLLKRFIFNEQYEVTAAHISLVNLDNTTQYWKNGNGARSSLSFNKNDLNGIIPIYGHWLCKNKNLFPRCDAICA
jgi:hypothetical protein